MKPNWHSAPDWANFLAQDASGEWNWFEFEPYQSNHYGGHWAYHIGRSAPATWRDTLEGRPR